MSNPLKNIFNVAANWKRAPLLLLLTATVGLAACSDADVASSNLSQAADNFEIQRRVVFYNGITGDYILNIEGRCSLGNYDDAGQLSVTCKTGDAEFKKHFLGLSDNVTYFVEQLEGANVSPYHYRVVFKPQVIVPDIDLRTDGGELVNPSRPEVTQTQSPAPQVQATPRVQATPQASQP